MSRLKVATTLTCLCCALPLSALAQPAPAPETGATDTAASAATGPDAATNADSDAAADADSDAAADADSDAAADADSDAAADAAYEAVLLRAVGAFDAGAWVEAHALFSEAHRMHPTARTSRTMGMASFNLGDYVRALGELQAALDGRDKPLTDKQRAHVSGLIGRARARTGSLALQLQPADAVVLLDGRPARRGPNGQVAMQPGSHEVTVRAEGYRTARRTLRAQAGRSQVLTLSLQATGAGEDATAVPTAGEVAARADHGTGDSKRTGAAVPPATDDGGPSTAVWITGAAGALALGAGMIAGGLAWSRVGGLEDDCPGRVCPDSEASKLETYDDLRLAAAGLSAGGAVLLLTSLTLAWLDDDSEAPAGRGSLHATAGGLGVRF